MFKKTINKAAGTYIKVFDTTKEVVEKIDNKFKETPKLRAVTYSAIIYFANCIVAGFRARTPIYCMYCGNYLEDCGCCHYCDGECDCYGKCDCDDDECDC